MDLEIRIAFQNNSGQKKNRKEKLLFQSIPGDYKNPGKIPEKSLVLLPAFCTNVGRRAEIA